MKKIDISSPKHPNTFAMVDDDDFDRINKWIWTAIPGGKTLYAVRGIGKRTAKRHHQMHRAILNAGEGSLVDHMDGNGLNNTKDNIRICNRAQNGMNRSKQAGLSSIYKGVSKPKGAKKFQASIFVAKKRIHLGYFEKEADAATAYNEAAKRHYGEFARINTIESSAA